MLLSILLIFVCHNAIAFLILPKILKSRIAKATYYIGAVIGTPIHELSHAIACIIFKHKIEDFCFFTVKNKGHLGYIKHSYNSKSIYQLTGCFFIALAPLITAMTAIFLFSPPDLQQINYSLDYSLIIKQMYKSSIFTLSLIESKDNGIVKATLISLLLFYCIPSKTDFKNAAKSSIVATLILFLAYVTIAIVDTYCFEAAKAVTQALQTLTKLTVITLFFYGLASVFWGVLALLTVINIKPKGSNNKHLKHNLML